MTSSVTFCWNFLYR